MEILKSSASTAISTRDTDGGLIEYRLATPGSGSVTEVINLSHTYNWSSHDYHRLYPFLLR